MKNLITKLASGLAAAAFVASLVPAAAFAVGPTTWFVDAAAPSGGDGKSTTTAFMTIADAMTSAQDGDTIMVAGGTYEGFSIDGKSNLTIEGAGDSTVIAPTSLIDTHIGHKYTSDMQASVFVNDSTNVSLENMKIESTSDTPGSGGADAVLFWNSSSGSLDNLTVEGEYTINGAQSGQGIAVDAGSGMTSTLNITGADISGFQKNGIDIVNGNGTSTGGNVNVTISGGTITGAGPTSAIAQNGILAWDMGAANVAATVNGTTISNLQYTGGPDQDTGILAYGNASISSISNTTMNSVDLYISADSSPIDASSGNTFDGIAPATASGADLATVEDKLDDSMSDDTVMPVYLLPHTLIVTKAVDNLGIKGAIDQAQSGDTVLVTPGTYAGPITITTSGISLVGKDGVTVTESSTDTFGYGMTVDNASGVTVSGIDFDASTLPSGYAFHAYHADHLALSHLSFIGSASSGGVDVNTSNDVSISNVSSTGFHKNGFAFTPQYLSTDTAADGITLNNVTSSNNGWAGIAFYTVGNDKSPTSIGGSASFSDVHFTGSNTISGNGEGVFIEGDTDANHIANSTVTAPVNTVTSDGSTLDLGSIAFSSNSVYDIENFQKANVTATSATFGGLTGLSMDSTAQAAEGTKIFDHTDNSVLGTVTFIGTLPGSGNSGSHNRHNGSGSSSNNGNNGNANNTNVGNNGSNNNNGSNGNPTGGAVLGAATFNFAADLHFGISGAEVKELQTELIAAGYSIPAGATGYYGPQTRAAVAKWQLEHGVKPSVGYFGPLSRAAYMAAGGFHSLMASSTTSS